MPVPAFLRHIDRRIIFLLIGASVALPLIWKPIFRDRPTPIVQAIYDKMEALPAGSRILLALDYGPSTAPELDPMAVALIRHGLRKNHRIVLFTLWSDGLGQIAKIMGGTLRPEFPEKQYGVDYVNLGYKAGGGGAINTMVVNLRTLITADGAGAPLDSLPLMAEVTDLRQFSVIVSLSAGDPGLKEWIQFAGDIADIPVMGGGTAVVAPELYPYYPQQMVGLMGGLKGASEYEAALVAGYPDMADREMAATIRMGPQVVSHLLIVLLVLIGNITYFLERRKAGRR
jgi:hypothetical protein